MKYYNKNKEIMLILFLSLILRILLSFFGSQHLDLGTFIAWAHILQNNSLTAFYNSWSDYLPGYLYVLWLLGKIDLYNIIPQTLLYKLPSILADITTGLFIYKIINKSKGKTAAIVGALIYMFNPAVFSNSSLWGQVDSFTALTSIATIYFLKENIFLSAFFLSVGTLIKPLTAFSFPIVLFCMYKEKWRFSKIFSYISAGFLIFIISFVPFWNHGSFLNFFIERLSISANQYPYMSVNAFNFWGMFGMWKPDNIVLQLLGYLSVLFAFFILAKKISKIENFEYYLLSFVFAASFIFFTRMHERHLLAVFAPLAIVVAENPLCIIFYFGFSVTYILNLYYSYIWMAFDFKKVFSDFAIKLIEIMNISLVISMFWIFARNIKVSWIIVRKKILSKFNHLESEDFALPKINIPTNIEKQILAIILLFAFLSRIFDLSQPTNMYFDEVYHAFTARVILSSESNKAWEWWNTSPNGFAYEWTHPPLAKLGMVLGMLALGQNSFGWRIPEAILGVGIVYLIYLLTKTIFKDNAMALISAGVYSLDGLALVMSRIGMNDNYILFFSLLSVLFFIKNKDFLSSLSFGLAIASKWSAVWSLPILGVLWIWRNKKFKKSLLW
ncbi:MAG: phospholipid carrier-dependent glycosyltransferase, partial [Bacteroidales bacterium]|nr:phospholipid carrier-dependent glycosyltransferase [Bacteroidales bacterium]